MLDAIRTVIVVATEWESRHGGLSTLNRALSVALARAGHKVFCLLPNANDKEKAEAKADGVTLIEAATVGAEPPDMELLRPPRLPSGVTPDVIIGHGRITGPAAQAQIEDSFPGAARLHFVHMASGEIEWFKDRGNAAARAEDRELKEIRLCRDATLVVPIGPRLHREVGNLVAALDSPPPLCRFDPALLIDIPPRQPPPGFHVLLMGRTEDFKLKGLDIAARAMALLGSRNLEQPPWLVVRGAPPGTGDALRDQLLVVAETRLDVRVREYTAAAERITDDLRRASIVLMPSRDEGFGLVGLEAIGARVPVLISDCSGLGEMLSACLPAHEAAFHIVKVTGNVQIDGAEWANKIEFILKDRSQAIERIDGLAATLASQFSWEASVRKILEQLPKTPPDGPTQAFWHALHAPSIAESSAEAADVDLPSPHQRLRTALREGNLHRAKTLLTPLTTSNAADREAVIVAAYALAALAELEDRPDHRLRLRRRAISVAAKSWKSMRDPAVGAVYADSVVTHFYDRLAEEERDVRDKALRDAKQAIEDALPTTEDPGTKAELLAQKGSLLGCQALVEPNWTRRRALVQERLRCSRLAVKFSNGPMALLALGQAEWMAARWEDNYERHVSHLNEAETALRHAAGYDTVSRLVYCRFLRLTHRPYRAIRAFLHYATSEANVWRRFAESQSHVIGEAALHLLLQGFDPDIVAIAAQHARLYLQEAVGTGIATARTHIALANVLALLGLQPDADAQLAQLKRVTHDSWLAVLEDAMRSIEEPASSELSRAFVLGLGDAAVWNQLGSFARRFVQNIGLARQLYETGLRLDSNQPEILMNLARVLSLSDNKQDVITASRYIDLAARKADRTWRWWRPVRRAVDEARHRLQLPALPVLPPLHKGWVEAEVTVQALRDRGTGAATLLRLLVSLSPGVRFNADFLETGGTILRVDTTDNNVILRGVGSESTRLGVAEFAAVVDGQIGLDSLIDSKTAHWPDFALPSPR